MNPSSDPKQVIVIGGGVTGLTIAHRLLAQASGPSAGRGVHVTIVESDDEVGGKIRTSPFAGISGVDEGPDAYLARVPHAVALARELGLGHEIVHPTSGHAAVMHKKLHPIPEGLLLGVPTGIMALAKSDLLSWRGKIRAGLEPILPSSGDHKDSIGNFIRQRFGKQVQQLLVDPLVGSIYAADTNNFSLAMVPQLATLATGRSLLLTARRQMADNPKSNSPIFETPRSGLAALTRALRESVESLGATILTSTQAQNIVRRDNSYEVEVSGAGEASLTADCVIVASPARSSAPIFRTIDPEVANTMGRAEHSSVVMVTLKTVETDLPVFAGLSGYLVPKPDQDRVTAVSFGSNKWAHWKPTDGSMILRVSLGRDGAKTHDLLHEWDDQRILRQVVDEVTLHTKTVITPETFRVTRWPDSFPQYRPGHLGYVDTVERSLQRNSPGVFVAGASWRGIGIPACVAQAENTAARAAEFLSLLRE